MIAIKCFVWAALLLAGWIEVPAEPRHLDPYVVLPGAWGWEGTDDCAVSPQRLRFSDDRRHMFLSITPRDERGKREARMEATYRLLGAVPNGLRMSLAGEKRMDAHGNPVTWDLMLLDSNQYCWHRGDWPEAGCTKSMLRCAGNPDLQ